MTPREDAPDQHPPRGLNGGSRPVPDPTVLTTELVDRGINGLRELLAAKSEGQMGIVLARFDGMDKAITLLQAARDRMPDEITAKIKDLERLHDEKFRSIQVQFAAVGTLSEQTKADTKTAVDAALSAQKEAGGKSELSTTKQIDQLIVLITTATKGLETIINDVKDRLTRLESEGRGSDAAKVTQQTSNTANISIVSVIVAVLGLIGGLLVAFFSKP